MRKIFFFAFLLFASLAVSAQTVIDISAIDPAYTTTFEAELVIDVATTASAVASPKLWYPNPFKGSSIAGAEISFDVYNYYGNDSIKVLGSLLALYDNQLGRMYFSNGSYLGYNAIGGWFDANMKNYGLDSNFIGGNTWKNVKLKFSGTGYALFINDTLAYDHNSTHVTMGGGLADYNNVIEFLENADSLVFGTGSWWSDNTRDGGSYYDLQYSYLKNITFSSMPSIEDSVDLSNVDAAYTTTFESETVIDVATTASKLADPNLWFVNPFRGKDFEGAEISFDVYNYYGNDSIRVLGSLLALYDAGLGRMYFTNGSYLGYNANGGWFDANLNSYALDSNFIGGNEWKNVTLKFSKGGYAMYIDNALAFTQHNEDITINGTLTDYSNVISFLQNADTLVIGTGSWWSDNQRDGGAYWDPQYSYLKNIKFKTFATSGINLGGNMEDPSAWNVYWGTNGNDTGDFEFNYTADAPAAGDGGCYRVTAAGQAANMLWQPVTIIPGHQYLLEGAYKYLADSAVNVWVEYFLTRIKPTGGDISTSLGWSLNTWMEGADLVFDGTFQDDFTLANTPKKEILIPDTVTQTEWYLVMKAGCWNNNDDSIPVFDILFDEIYMYDIGVPLYTEFYVDQVVDGTIDSDEDFKVTLRMSWDVDSVYLAFDILDDSINTTISTDIWNNDNVEVYFDMQNTKIQNWPRDNGWPMPYTSGTDGNYQLRMVHDSAWAKYNGDLLPGTNLVHGLIDGGYQITVNFAWKELDSTFVPAADSLIGFDVLASDNDADPDYRNQVSWNAPNTLIWIDPAQWATLKLLSNGTFEVIPDNEKPTNPANVVATVDGTTVNLTWDASTDNRVVQSYIINQGLNNIDTILALQTGNSYTISDLAEGGYTFGVTAVDIYGNMSTKINAARVNITGVEELSNSHMTVYPNPSEGIFNIRSESNVNVSLEVYNITGGLVTSAEFSENYVLDLSSYSKGVYFLHMKAKGEKHITKLIVQ
ncbi:MAG: T9SS type A sorting domain-containing protein [Bacteroidales bacterium]|nr:T9SS type A sorting domain-containing protein [Bacteroidales bacterium]MBN2762128.1 T9SS type A sorting domain-containing protein [Bacteroidales bacterium]